MSKMVIFVLQYVHAVILEMSPGSLDVHYEVSYAFFDASDTPRYWNITKFQFWYCFTGFSIGGPICVC